MSLRGFWSANHLKEVRVAEARPAIGVTAPKSGFNEGALYYVSDNSED